MFQQLRIFKNFNTGLFNKINEDLGYDQIEKSQKIKKLERNLRFSDLDKRLENKRKLLVNFKTNYFPRDDYHKEIKLRDLYNLERYLNSINIEQLCNLSEDQIDYMLYLYDTNKLNKSSKDDEDNEDLEDYPGDSLPEPRKTKEELDRELEEYMNRPKKSV